LFAHRNTTIPLDIAAAHQILTIFHLLVLMHQTPSIP
jgi:hypothetical protein